MTGASRFKRDGFRWRRWVVIVMLILLLGWLALQLFGPYSSVRNRLVYQVGVDRLQQWAVSVLDDPPEEFQVEPPPAVLRQEYIPEDIRRLGCQMIVYEPGQSDSDREEHILIICGSGFYHYGFRVGRPGYEPISDGEFAFEKLADGVWGQYGG